MKIDRPPCRRCGGMMVETYSDLLSPNERATDVLIWRCVNCGDYLDRLVLQNRWAQQIGSPAFRRLANRRSDPKHAPVAATHRQRTAA